MLTSIPPAFILIIGALLIPFIKGPAKKLWAILLPAVAFYTISKLDASMSMSIPFLSQDLTLLRVDNLSKSFGYIFTLSAVAAFIYAWYEDKSMEYVSGLLYMGSALGVVFSGDLISLYVFWELMAITSTFLILARKKKASIQAAKRYILVHLAGGLVLLAGIVLHIQESGEIAFNAFSNPTLASGLILVGFLVNAAAIPVSSWLPDAYPEATVMGGVILSVYTSKTAVYTLLRGFAGWDILIGLGCAMTIYGMIYALLENDMRRILSYSIVNQVGFMVCAAGIGTPLAIAGAVAHAFAHIIYKALLWMSAGAVLYRTGKSKLTQLGGLYRSMPICMILASIGAIASLSFPLTSGFTTKTMILMAAKYQHLFWPWVILEIASAGVLFHSGLKFPYFVFFNKDQGLRPKEAPKSMMLGMGILAFLCIYIGCFPEQIYQVLPHSDLVMKKMPILFSDIYIHQFSNVVTQLQLLLFAVLVFFLCLPLFKRQDTISIDFDWVYRKGSTLFYMIMDRVLNGLNHQTDQWVIRKGLVNLSKHVQSLPAKCLSLLLRPVWQFKEMDASHMSEQHTQLERRVALSTLPISYSAIFIFVILCVFIYL
ncbi:MAG: Na(+)/H(+) antiporter subunit D [Actinobacteria bacterium]|nr:Na(+)/H(+) antiporter subunit D [Actinomycetota bacterium]